MKNKIALSIVAFLFSNFINAQTWQYVNEVNGASISDMIVYNGELYAADGYGGTAYSINSCASDIVKYDGSSWSCVGNNLQVAMVNVFEEFNGELYAGGYFTFNNGTQSNVIKLQSGNWVPIRSHFSYDAKSLCVFNNELYEVEKKWGQDSIFINKWNNVSWDTVLFLFPTQYLITINALATFNNELYIGGEFENIAGVTTNNIIKYDGATYSSVGGGTPQCFSMIDNFFVFNNNLYASGKFGIIGSISANRIARWDGSAWYSLGNGLTGGLDVLNGGTMYHLNNNIIVSEFFVDSSSISSNRIKEWDGINWTVISPVNHSGIRSMINYNNELYAGGAFDQNPYVLMKYGFANGIEENEVEDIFLFPNPAIDEIRIEGLKERDKWVEVWDMVGKKIFLPINPLKGTSARIDVSGLTSGIYFVSVRDEKNNLVVRKIVKL